MIARTVKVERIALHAGLLTVALAALCWVFALGDAPSVLFGGAISVLNLRLIRMLVSRLMSPEAAGPRLASVVTTKFLILLALLATAFQRLPIDGASFLIGGGTLLLAILLDALLLGDPVVDSDESDGNGNGL